MSVATGICDTTRVGRIIPRLVVVASRVELPEVVVMTVSSSDVMRDSMVVSVYLVEEVDDDELIDEVDGTAVG